MKSSLAIIGEALLAAACLEAQTSPFRDTEDRAFDVGGIGTRTGILPTPLPEPAVGYGGPRAPLDPRRWWLIAFGGGGWTDAGSIKVLKNQSVHAGGFGFRYLIARLLGIQGPGSRSRPHLAEPRAGALAGRGSRA